MGGPRNPVGDCDGGVPVDTHVIRAVRAAARRLRRLSSGAITLFADGSTPCSTSDGASLVLVSAPAGAGKSTALSGWLDRREGGAHWYSLESSRQ